MNLPKLVITKHKPKLVLTNRTNAKVPVRIRGMDFESINAAARHFKINPSTVRDALDEGRLDFVGLGVTRKRKIKANGKLFDSHTDAAHEYGFKPQAVTNAVHNARQKGRNTMVYRGVRFDWEDYHTPAAKRDAARHAVSHRAMIYGTGITKKAA